ncbi:MAG: NUDIX hydrolase, partial [Sphaerospermopsis sp. SIO1G2]|nr:NUDIX hydrolase [Sphaerospermopsis sp. SIO1G2]
MPEHNHKKTPNTQNQQPLADFKVGVDNVIFSVDTAQNRLLVLL